MFELRVEVVGWPRKSTGKKLSAKDDKIVSADFGVRAVSALAA